MTDIIKKPVHTALIPLTHIEKLQASGKLSKSLVSTEAKHADSLPVETKQRHTKVSVPKVQVSNSVKQGKIKTRLKIVHNSLPKIEGDLKPPCETCVTAPCCRAFLVELTKEEYESGLYDPYIVEITTESSNQLKYNFNMFIPTLTVMSALHKDKNAYYLDSKIGEPCPFLTENNKCGIYNDRPIVCRSYTCVGDDRITEGMRNGTEYVLGE